MRGYWISFHCAIKSKTYCKGNELLFYYHCHSVGNINMDGSMENDKKYDENIRIKKNRYWKICNSGILLLQIMLKRYIFFFYNKTE